MCALGRVGKIARRVLALVVYVPPGIRAQELEELKEAVATEVAALKATYCNPLIFVAGDFNHRDFGGALAEVDVIISLIKTGPTRGPNTINLVFSNAKPEDVKENAVLPPLQLYNGTDSNHKCLFLPTH